ncbi:helicase [Plasmodium cynomolgi strain B]|uniref:Helicase n=1 Tax=Plasmodium cynomolgi (strain B) TaxID=1120755 RepID=K6UVY1_PLACD|nr:helicase [Plasmodium cynomolgi strain B]GAB67749.1 helicase [Plasmodium cynomolgi strain B]
MFPPDKSRKEKKPNPFICHRRLGIYKKKIYRRRHQLIYVSLSGRIYTNANYKDAVQLDNRILSELNISKTGAKSSIPDVNLLYSSVNELMNLGADAHLDEKTFEYYCIPQSIISEYNRLGIYELYKEQADCLRNILENEQVEKNVQSKVEDRTPEERTPEKKHSQNVDSFFNAEFFTPLEELKHKDEEKRGREVPPQRGPTDGRGLSPQRGPTNGPGLSPQRGPANGPGLSPQRRPTNAHPCDDKWDTLYENNDTRNNFFYKNFLFNIPTGMGKTIIYDILIIRLVLYKGYRAIVTLPTVSLINEKNDYYEKLLGENTVSLNIKKFNSSNFTGYSYSLSTDIALCTYEQANIILNIIIKNNLKCNYIFIIDEIHYINDMQRGVFIESLLTKIKYIQRNCESVFNIRAYGFSATLSNVDQIGEWLDAKVHVSKEKLQKIKYLYKIESAIYKDIHKKELERTLGAPFYLDPDHLVYLLSEELILQRNVLIFCPTKKKSEQVAHFISNIMPYYLKNRNYKVNREVAERREKLVSELKELSVKIPDVDKLILNGIFFHHSELEKNEKGIVEGAFRSKTLFCLCCTTTLSVGVNLNVHTIIIRSIRLGTAFLTKEQIVQIAGRCGRVKKAHAGRGPAGAVGGPSSAAAACTPVRDYDLDCDGKVLIFLTPCDKTYMEKILKDDVDVCKLKTKLHNFQLCKFILEFIELNLIKTKKDMVDLLVLYTLKFFKVDEKEEKKNRTSSNSAVNCRDLIMQEVKQTFQYLFENKLIIIPYEKEQCYYYYLFAKIYNVNLYKMEQIFDFHFLCQYINMDTLIKCNLQQKMDIFKKLHRNYKLKEFMNKEKQQSFFSLPFLTILLIFKDTQINTNLFQNLFVQLVKYLFLVNINSKQFDFYVYDILRDDDVIACTEVSPYVHPICNALDFIFNFSFIQYVYVKGFPTDVLLMIFVFCINSEISLKIHFDVYEEMLTSSSGPEGGDVRKIFHYFDLSMDKLKRFKANGNDDLCAQCAKDILRGEINIDEICENFEWVKIKRFYFSLIVYDLFREDIYTVGRKYRLKMKEIKKLYVKCCHNLAFNCKVLRNFKNSLDIFCIVLDNLLLKMKSKNLAFIF